VEEEMAAWGERGSGERKWEGGGRGEIKEYDMWVLHLVVDIEESIENGWLREN